VQAAASLPVAFAQVREDPRLDGERAARYPGGTVVMIASGGDTACCLSRLPLGRLLVVDLNPAQLALTRCKWHLARHATREQALQWLGHLPMAGRAQHLRATLQALDLPTEALGPLPFVAEVGPDFAGRYERLFQALRKALARLKWEEAFAEVMSLENLVALFGPLATHNPRRSFASHFAERTRRAVDRSDGPTNPFLSQLLTGSFGSGPAWDWLGPEKWGAPMVELECHCGPMHEVLSQLPEASVDWLQLSNILDWLGPQPAGQLLQACHRVLKPGGQVLVRQLNSCLDIPALPAGLHWDLEAGAAMEADDRSFFYPQLHVGEKR
jgi:S-adenosylmethionine-diacylglycerol 3-amino-3-carboxypropyl transferase